MINEILPVPEDKQKVSLSSEERDWLSIPDEALWVEFKVGSQEAYRELYDRFFDLLFRYGRKITPDRALVKDTIQDLFVELWKSRENLSTPASPRHYLLKALRGKLARTIRQGHRVLYLNDLTGEYYREIINSYETELVQLQLSEEQKQCLVEALQQLTNRQREVIFLRFYQDLSYEEIAGIMDIGTDSLYNLVSKAIDRLRGSLKREVLCLLLLGLMPGSLTTIC
ncbi:sigma-70 family RNA polymerase sigma factor [soil metagenome]